MDIYCPKCGEPCDIDTLHDYAQEHHTTFREIHRLFQTVGCANSMPNYRWTCTPSRNPQRAQVARMLGEIMGDDVDGIASFFEDFGDQLDMEEMEI